MTPKQFIRSQLRLVGVSDAAYDNERRAWKGTVNGQFHRVPGDHMLDAAFNFARKLGLTVDLSPLAYAPIKGIHFTSEVAAIKNKPRPARKKRGSVNPAEGPRARALGVDTGAHKGGGRK